MSSERETESFAEAVEEHGREGLEILMGTSSFLAHGIIYILMVLLFVIFIWSFYGRADVIISAEGQIDAESEMKRIYTPAAGELIDVYATEGMTVSGGDLLARIKNVMVEELMLQVQPEEIGDETPIFGPEGLGLDSVDALQLVIALEKNFGLKISEGNAAKEILRNVTTIGEAIRALA